MGRSSVIVADDHPIFLDGVVAAIEACPYLLLLGTAGDGIEALRRVRSDTPDVLVLDLDLPDWLVWVLRAKNALIAAFIALAVIGALRQGRRR